MTSRTANHHRLYWLAFGWLVVVLLCLAPWWRNYPYIRDFFDYGLMMVAAGRINAGQLPFADWVTPGQSGSYWLNALAERWLGGDYIGLTRGNAIFITLIVGLLAIPLRRQGNPVASMLIVFCVVVGSASQHTLIWYNAIVTVTLAVIAWTTALHPVIGRRAIGPTALVVAMLIWSGITKINFHTLALAIACAWTLRAGVLGAAAWRQVIMTLGVWLVAGLILPVCLELQLTGASIAQWIHNVIVLPFSAPGYEIERFLNLEFLLTPVHDYYGPTLQPVGLILLIWAAMTVGLAWSNCQGIDRLFLVGAAIMALGGTFALIATNHEIVYVGLSSGVALVVSLWIGFGLWERAHFRNWLLVAPATLLAVIMFYSAWLGQRSQFGHSSLARSDYRTFTSEDAKSFEYFVGTYMPPSIHESLVKLDQFIPSPSETNKVPVFYSTGAEFLERIWPNRILPDMPLLIASLTLSEQRAEELVGEFGFPPGFELLVGMTSWTGSWPNDLENVVRKNAVENWKAGVFSLSRFSGQGLYPVLPPIENGIQSLFHFGGNLDPQQVEVTKPLWPHELLEGGDGRAFLGTSKGNGRFVFKRSSYRLTGQIVMQRPPDSGDDPVNARFRVIDTSIPEGEMGWVIWEANRTLPPGTDSLIEDYFVDSRGQPIGFDVAVSDNSSHAVQAGFFMPEIQHSDSARPSPPVMRSLLPPENLDKDRIASSLMPADWLDKFKIVVRGGKVSPENQLLLFPGDELWLYSEEPIQEIIGKIQSADSTDTKSSMIARIVWYRGGRIQQLRSHEFGGNTGPFHFNAWPAEQNGWYGILMDPGFSLTGVEVTIDSVKSN